VTELPGGTVTFLFSDIEGSTRLLERLGDRYSDVHRDHRRILREELVRAAGREVDTQGDAFFFSFARAKEAARGAVAAQRALAAHEWPDGVDVKVRMGLHTGEPTIGEEGYVGMDVVRAARICSAGHGGQILLSEATRVLLGSDLPDGVVVRDLGDAELKDVERERIFQLELTDTSDGFPPLRTAPRETEADQLAKQIESRVHEQILAVFDRPTRGAPTAPTKLLRVTLIFGLVVLVLLVAAAIAIVLLVLAFS
jgi:class 3 adenylate cyclase